MTDKQRSTAAGRIKRKNRGRGSRAPAENETCAGTDRLQTLRPAADRERADLEPERGQINGIAFAPDGWPAAFECSRGIAVSDME